MNIAIVLEYGLKVFLKPNQGICSWISHLFSSQFEETIRNAYKTVVFLKQAPTCQAN